MLCYSPPARRRLENPSVEAVDLSPDTVLSSIIFCLCSKSQMHRCYLLLIVLSIVVHGQTVLLQFQSTSSSGIGSTTTLLSNVQTAIQAQTGSLFYVSLHSASTTTATVAADAPSTAALTSLLPAASLFSLNSTMMQNYGLSLMDAAVPSLAEVSPSNFISMSTNCTINVGSATCGSTMNFTNPNPAAVFPAFAVVSVEFAFNGLQNSGGLPGAGLSCTTFSQSTESCNYVSVCTYSVPLDRATSTSGFTGWRRDDQSITLQPILASPLQSSMLQSCSGATSVRVDMQVNYVAIPAHQAAAELFTYNNTQAKLELVRNDDVWIAMISLASISLVFWIITIFFYTREDFFEDWWDFDDMCGCDFTPNLCLKAVPAFMGSILFLLSICLLFMYFTMEKTEATHWVMLSEYHSPRCDQSLLSWRPHRLSGFAADDGCHRLTARGTREGASYMRGTCTEDRSSVTITVTPNLASCEKGVDGETVTVTTGTCMNESIIFGSSANSSTKKKSSDMQYVVVSCEEIAVATSSFDLFSQDAQEPTLEVTEVEPPTTLIIKDIDSGEIPFQYQRGSFSLDVGEDDLAKDGESSPPLVLGNYSASNAPTGIVISAVLFQDPSQPNVTEPPRDPADGPFSGAEFNTPLNVPEADAAGESDSEMIQRSKRAFEGSFRYQGVAGSTFDLGKIAAGEENEDAAFTITFWMRADQSTVGFPIVVADNWVRRTTTAESSPLIDRLMDISLGGAPFSTFFKKDWNIYLAIGVDAIRKTVRMSSARPLPEDVETATETEMQQVFELEWDTHSVPNIARLFDGGWHFIAITSQVSNERRSARLFLDCETSFVDDGWQQCFPAGMTLDPIPADPANKTIFDPSERALSQGALFTGYFNGGLYNVRFHDGALEQERIIGLGASSMRQFATISTMGSFALGTGVGSIFVVFLALTIYQFFGESAKNDDLAEEDRAEVKDEAQGQAEEAGAAGAKAMTGKVGQFAGKMTGITSSTRESLAKLKAMVTLFLGVVQSMALYFQGWRWPFVYEFYVGWFVFPFSLNLNLPKLGIEVNPLAGPLLQISIVLLAFLTLVFLVYADKEDFEDGLSNLDSKLSDDAEDEDGSGGPPCHDHEYHVLASADKSIPTKLRGDLIIWPENSTYLRDKEWTESLQQAMDTMEKEESLECALIPPRGKQYRAAKEADDSDSDDDDDEEDSDNPLMMEGSDDDWAQHPDPNRKTIQRAKRTAKAKKAKKDRLKEDTEVFRGPVFLSRETAQKGKITPYTLRIVDSKTAKEYPIRVKRDSDPEDCPKHSLALIVGSDEQRKGRKCASCITPWCKEIKKCDGLSGEFFVCRKKTCKFAICGGCSGLSEDQKAEARLNAASKSLAANDAPQFNYAFYIQGPTPTRLKYQETPEELMDSGSDGDPLERALTGKKVKGKPKKHGKHGFSDELTDALEAAIKGLLPGKGETGEKVACQVTCCDDDSRPSKSPEGYTDGDMVVYAIGAATGIEYSLHFKSVDGKVVDVIAKRTSPTHLCPKCNVRLVPGRPEVHLTLADNLDENGDSKYQCAAYINPWDTNHCSGVDEDEPFYVCPEERCTFCICADCAQLPPSTRGIAEVIGQIKALGIGGAVGFITLLAASALYFPTVQTAIMILFCHNSFQCEFPGCYKTLSPQFITTISAAAGTLLLVGVGFLVFLGSVAYRRKKYIICDADVIRDGYLTKDKEAPKSFFGILLCDITPESWSRILDQDQTILRPLYDQFEFKHMCILPVFNIFKVLLVLPIVLLPPNSLRQLIGAAVVECLQLFFLCATNAYVNAWIDTLSKTGSLHQLFQLSCMSFHRVMIANDPEAEGLSLYMTIGSGIYALFLIIVMFHVAIIPAIRGALERRRRREAFRQERLEQINEKKRLLAEAQTRAAAEPPKGREPMFEESKAGAAAQQNGQPTANGKKSAPPPPKKKPAGKAAQKPKTVDLDEDSEMSSIGDIDIGNISFGSDDLNLGDLNLGDLNLDDLNLGDLDGKKPPEAKAPPKAPLPAPKKASNPFASTPPPPPKQSSATKSPPAARAAGDDLL